MLSCKLNMTLERFIIFVFLTLDIALFVQPYPSEGACIFQCMQIVVANQGIKHRVKDGGRDDACVYKCEKHGECFTKWSQNALRCLREMYVYRRKCCLLSQQLNLSHQF